MIWRLNGLTLRIQNHPVASTMVFLAVDFEWLLVVRAFASSVSYSTVRGNLAKWAVPVQRFCNEIYYNKINLISGLSSKALRRYICLAKFEELVLEF